MSEISDIKKIPKNEQEYLELADHFKTVLDEKDTELRFYKKKYMAYKRHIARIYGLACEINEYVEDILINEMSFTFQILMNSILSLTTSVLFSKEDKELDIIDEVLIIP